MKRWIALALIGSALVLSILLLGPDRAARELERGEPGAPRVAPSEPLLDPARALAPEVSHAGARDEPPETTVAPALTAPQEADVPLVVLFQVVDTEGVAVADCVVTCHLGLLVGGISPDLREAVRTGPDGIARFRFVERKPPMGGLPWGVRAEGRTEDGRATEVVELRVPFGRGPHPLRMLPGGSVLVRVLQEAAGAPVEAAGVHLSPVAALDTKERVIVGSTDALGEVRFADVSAGEYRTHVRAPHSEHDLRGELVVEEGGEHVLEVVLASDGLALAVSGVFLDEAGTPTFDASLWVGESRVHGELVYPDVTGRFALYRVPCDQLLVRLSERVDTDRYAPESVSVPFGTTGLVFRRVETLERRVSRFRVVDADTGESVHGSGVALYFEDSMQSMDVNSGFHGEDHVWIVHADRRALRWLAWAPGYVRASGLLPDGDAMLEVRLERGDVAPLLVLDALDERPIEGARFLDQGLMEWGTSDGEGRLVLRDASPAGRLAIERLGYRPRVWYASWPAEVVWLERD